MKRLSFLFFFPLLMLCSKQDKQDVLAVVGKTTVCKADYEALSKVRKYYPTDLHEDFPAYRSAITQLVETEAIFQSARKMPTNAIKNSKDWQWKKIFFSAQSFIIEQLSVNMGSTENEIRNFYDSNKETFKKTVKVDSLRDSTYYQDIAAVRDTIIQVLFVSKYPPDSAFLSKLDKGDLANAGDHWFYSSKRNPPAFFMKAFYTEKYQKPFPDSINEVFGDDKIVTTEDMQTILSWIRPEYRHQYESEQGSKRLLEFLLQWKLFSEKADQFAFTTTPEFKKVMQWAWKVEVVNEYVRSEIVSRAQANLKVDTAMVPYLVYDESNSVYQVDTAVLHTKVSDLLGRKKKLKVDSLIYEIRKAAGIRFTQNDLKDDKEDDPVALIRQADSLRDTGDVENAERIYTTLVNEFAFTPSGKASQYELAKIMTERQSYSGAISNYRNYLLSSPDPKKKSITFFMIGFIYDEYMDKSELAEANYKWVLKNDPESELADDAEFMMLHLGEPMNSVEELQAQTLRQNRKVDSFEDVSLETGSDSASAEPTPMSN